MQVCYFASDFHLGAPSEAQSREREGAIVDWLDFISKDATDIFLVGDIFDFWFEYSTVVPKGFTRLFGKIAALSDGGIQFHFFMGNHDMWVRDYFENEFGMKIYAEPIQLTLHGKSVYLGHGDGLGPGDRGYKFIKVFLRSKICQWAFARLHPNFGIRLAKFFSNKSRKGSAYEHRFLGFDKEWLFQYANDHQKIKKHDFYIFGHRHLPYILTIEDGVYYNLGEWMNYQTFMKISDEQPAYYQWNGQEAVPYHPPYGNE